MKLMMIICKKMIQDYLLMIKYTDQSNFLQKLMNQIYMQEKFKNN